MKIRINKRYVWDSKKCIPLQILKYAFIGGLIYILYILLYFAFVPLSTMG